MEIPGVSSENVSLLDSTQFFSGVSCPPNKPGTLEFPAPSQHPWDPWLPLQVRSCEALVALAAWGRETPGSQPALALLPLLLWKLATGIHP